MTFKLKELEQLNTDFAHIKALLLKRSNNITSLNQLKETTRSEMLLLQATLSDVEKKIVRLQEENLTELKPSRQTSIEDLTRTYYGTMKVALKQTKDLSLAKHINDVINTYQIKINDNVVTREAKPDIYEEAKFQIGFNAFIKTMLFRSSDSRNGINPHHIYSKIKMPDSVSVAITNEQLEAFAVRGYKLEKGAQKAIINSLVSVNSDIRPQNHTVKSVFSPSIQENFVSYIKLKEAVKDIIYAELASKDETTTEIKDLEQPRRAQLEFLTKIEQLLDASSLADNEKMALLAGKLHLLYRVIELEYAYSPTSPKGSILNKGSEVFNRLDDLLQIKKTSPQDMEAMIFEINEFICSMVIVPIPERDQKNGISKGINVNNPFAGIEELNLNGILNLAQEMICESRCNAVKKVMADLKPANASLLSKFTNIFSSKPKETPCDHTTCPSNTGNHL